MVSGMIYIKVHIYLQQANGKFLNSKVAGAVGEGIRPMKCFEEYKELVRLHKDLDII